jgi:WD repeat-containing protein 35
LSRPAIRFRDLEVRCVILDDLLTRPEQPSRDFVVDFESKSLREAREKVTVGGIQVLEATSLRLSQCSV